MMLLSKYYSVLVINTFLKFVSSQVIQDDIKYWFLLFVKTDKFHISNWSIWHAQIYLL